MTHTPVQIESWVAALLNEARRDLVFLWNIQRGSFGGLNVTPDKQVLVQVIEALVTNGCLVGFGDPSASNWSVPPELQVPREQLSEAILHFWEGNPKENEFITFVLRESKAAEA